MEHINQNQQAKLWSENSVCFSIVGILYILVVYFTSFAFNYIKPCFDLFQFSYNFMTRGFCNLNLSDRIQAETDED